MFSGLWGSEPLKSIFSCYLFLKKICCARLISVLILFAYILGITRTFIAIFTDLSLISYSLKVEKLVEYKEELKKNTNHLPQSGQFRTRIAQQIITAKQCNFIAKRHVTVQR